MSGFAIKGRFSSRMAAALQFVCELAQQKAKYTKGGFHPASGFTPAPRELSPLEERLYHASLRYLLRNFQRDIKTINTQGEADDVSAWIAAASIYAQFCLSATQEYAEGSALEMEMQEFTSDVPPRPVPLVLTDLEEEVYEAAIAYIMRSYDIDVADNMLCATSVSDDPEDMPMDGPVG